MFYNQDYLLSKQVGLRIVWLASTLGSENAAAFRKLQKREIAAVDVSKTCDAVARPSQPLALRTSSHLMYGVVRVYNKQAEYWISDVQSSYASIRKLILQTSHGTVTTLGGIVLVGQDTSTIDMPGGRRHSDNVTATVQAEMYRNDLHFDAAEWGDPEGEEGDDGTTRFVLTNDSLSMFGSSAYESERARDASFDLGLALTPPPGQPFTAAASTTGRRDTSNLQRHAGMDTTFELNMDQFDLPQPADADHGVQLDLGTDIDMVGADGVDMNAFLDDQQGFDLPPLDGDVNTADMTNAEDQDLPPSSSQEGDGERASKRARLALQDSAIALSDARIVSHREQYVDRMARLRAGEALRRLKKDAEREAPLLVFGPTVDLSSTSMLAGLWTTGMDFQIAQMLQMNAPQQGQDRTKRGRADDGRVANGNNNAVINADEQERMPFDDNDMPFFGDEPGMVGGPQSGDLPRESTPEWGAEVGRAELSSESMEMPWNRAMADQQAFGDSTMAGETTVGVSTRSFSIETPTGLRRQARESSMSRASGAGGGGRPTLGAAAADGSVTGGEDAAYVSNTQVIAERDVLHFHNYAVVIRDQLEGSQPLFFSDLAPVAGSSPAIAARAFHHILSLETSHRLSAKQAEPFGEIEIEIL